MKCRDIGDAGGHMKIFISWSGDRSLALAQALHGWLPLVLHYVDPWLSKADIDAGQRWDDELSKTLNECNFGISCVTNDNLLAPWLLFEAGALAKSVEEGKLVPLLLGLDMKDFSGPLSRFQAKKTDKVGVSEILTSINKAAANGIPDARLADLLDLAWDKLEQKIGEIPAAAVPSKPARKEADILEEMVSSIRSVEARVRDMSDEEMSFKRMRRKGKFYPPMMMDMMHSIAEGPSDPILLLVVASLFREDAPWLYELASAAYKAIREGGGEEAHTSIRRFRRGLEMLVHSPMSRELGMDRELVHYLMREIEPMLDDIFSERLRPGRRAKGKIALQDSAVGSDKE
jgi:hypothetical protein